jgi:hypothetical protein
MRAVKYKLISTMSLLAVLGSSAARGEGLNPLEDRFSLSLGTFMLGTDTQIRVDGTTGRGTEIDTERDLGLHDADRFRVDGYWRFADRHKLRVLYFDTKNSASRTLDRDLNVGETTFPINLTIDASFETRVTELAYEYAFVRRDNYEIAGTVGIHDLHFGLDVSATQQNTTQTLELSRDANASGPLPVIGFRGIWRFHPNFYLDAQAQFFKISLDPYDGRLDDYTASVVWTPFKHFGLGVGYNEFVTHVDVSADRFNGNLRWRYGGARIFVTASF